MPTVQERRYGSGGAVSVQGPPCVPCVVRLVDKEEAVSVTIHCSTTCANERGVCALHRRSSARYGHRWRRFRLAFFCGSYPHQQQHPDIAPGLCVRCWMGGKIQAAVDLDHVVPLRDDVRTDADPRMYDGLFNGLCRPCHREKTWEDRLAR